MVSQLTQLRVFSNTDVYMQSLQHLSVRAELILRKIQYIILIVTVIIVALSCIRFFYHAYAILRFPYEMISGEGLLLQEVSALRNRLPLYTDPNHYPYIVAIYPPIFALLSILPSYMFGISITSIRVTAICSTFSICVAIAISIYLAVHKRIVSILCGLSYVGMVFVYDWGSFGRVDSLSLVFSLLAIITLQRTISPQWITISALLCSLGIYTKQTALAAPIGICVYLFLIDKRQLLLFGSMFIAIVLLLFFALNSISSNQFYLQMIHYNAQSYSIRSFISYTKTFIFLCIFLLMPSLIYTYIQVFREKRYSLLTIYFIVSACMTLTIGRTGSTINHLLEFTATMYIMFGIFWASSSIQSSWKTSFFCFLIVAHLLWSVIFIYAPFQVYKRDAVFGYNPTRVDLAQCNALDRYVDNAQGDILAEELGIAVAHGKTAIGSAWMFNVLRGKGLIDRGYDQLKDDVSHKRFSLIILHWQSYPSDFLFNVASHYHKVDTINCRYSWQIYVP